MNLLLTVYAFQLESRAD